MSEARNLKAVIFAGGKGTRLAPFTTVLPKPLVPVGDMPILEIMLNQLAHFGVREVVIAVGHLSSLIRAYLDSHPLREKLNISYYQETQPLGTAGAIAEIDGLDHPFFAMNGDVLTSLNFTGLMQSHIESEARLTVAVKRRSIQIELGVLDIDEASNVIDYTEKPTSSYLASMGIYACDPSIRQHMEPGGQIDLPTLVLKLIERGERVHAYEPDVFWLDMGNRGDLELATAAFQKDRHLFLPDDV